MIKQNLTQPVETEKKNTNAYSYLDSLSIRKNFNYMFTGMRAEMTQFNNS